MRGIGGRVNYEGMGMVKGIGRVNKKQSCNLVCYH